METNLPNDTNFRAFVRFELFVTIRDEYDFYLDEQPEQDVATQPPQGELPDIALTVPSAAIEKDIGAVMPRLLCSLPQSGHSAEESRCVILRMASNWFRQSVQRYS